MRYAAAVLTSWLIVSNLPSGQAWSVWTESGHDEWLLSLSHSGQTYFIQSLLLSRIFWTGALAATSSQTMTSLLLVMATKMLQTTRRCNVHAEIGLSILFPAAHRRCGSRGSPSRPQGVRLSSSVKRSHFRATVLVGYCSELNSLVHAARNPPNR